jgi:hypothetical protein
MTPESNRKRAGKGGLVSSHEQRKAWGVGLNIVLVPYYRWTVYSATGHSWRYSGILDGRVIDRIVCVRSAEIVGLYVYPKK